MVSMSMPSHVTVKGFSTMNVAPDIRRVTLGITASGDMDGNPFQEPLFYPTLIRRILSKCAVPHQISGDTGIKLLAGSVTGREEEQQMAYMRQYETELDVTFRIDMPVSPKVWSRFMQVLHNELPKTPIRISMEYVIAHTQELEMLLLHRAMENARAKAHALASLNLCRLGNLVAIEENVTQPSHSSSAAVILTCEITAIWQLISDPVCGDCDV